jgi:hypothetical protein
VVDPWRQVELGRRYFFGGQFLHGSPWDNAVLARDETAGGKLDIISKKWGSVVGGTRKPLVQDVENCSIKLVLAVIMDIGNPFVALSPGIPIPQTVRDVSDGPLVTFSCCYHSFCCRRKML